METPMSPSPDIAEAREHAWTPFEDHAGREPDAYERHYNPRAAVPHFATYAARRGPLNERALRERRSAADVPYGPHPRHRLDIYRAVSGDAAPVHVFFHGGYWRSGDKVNFAFLGASLAEQGITAIIPNYELCPDSDLGQVVHSARAAFAWVMSNVATYGGDPSRLTLSGHSAGAHLCAAILCDDALDRLAPGIAIRGATFLSGAFDPTPALHARINSEIGLTPAIASRYNMERRLPRVRCPSHIFVGGDEPPGWIALSERYDRHLGANGLDSAFEILPGFHHFDITDLYGQSDSPVCRAIRGQIGSA